MPVRLATHAMGTRFELALAGASERGLLAAGEEALREVALWHDRLSAFQRDSVIAQINREAGSRPVRAPREVLGLLLLSRDLWLASGGAFDPAVGGAMRRLGFHPGDAGDVTGASFASVEVDDAASTVVFTQPGVRLDLGAIAKGWALDRAAEVLRECGVTCALLHGGTSSIVAIGSPSGERAWRIAIRGESGVDVIAMLGDEALGVSAPRGRTVAGKAGTLGHILDPRTGRPAHAACTAAVLGRSAAACDAWSTALAVLGSRPTTMPEELVGVIETAPGAWTITGRAGTSLQPRTPSEVPAA
jgi:thiamine biosynthesis lipoprotein